MCYNRFCFLEKLVTEKKISEEKSRRKSISVSYTHLTLPTNSRV